MTSSKAVPAEATNGTRVEEEYDHVIARHYKEWVLYQVTEWDEHWRPVRGYVIAHSPSRKAISEALRKEPVRTKDMPYQPYYSFFALPEARVGESIPEAGERFRKIRAEVLAEANDRSEG
jgi:hypothetical protein